MSQQRKEFIKQLFQQLKTEDYLLLKFTEENLSAIDDHSDLDIFLPNKNWELIRWLVEKDNTITGVKFHLQSFMCQLFVHFSDGGFLQIDCLFELIRKDLIYLTKEDLFSNQKIKAGVKTYSEVTLLEHLILFNQLNYAGVPEKYIRFFSKLPEHKCKEILEKINRKYNLNVTGINQLIKFDDKLRDRLLSYIKNIPCNNFTSRIGNNFSYLSDSIKNLIQQRGFLISFTGVDGAGKSTILEETRLMLSKKFRKKTVVLRHRPSLLPILSSYKYGKANAEKRAATRLPRQGNNKSQFKSFLRFAYYFSDYLIGRSYVFFKYQLRNYIVLYDRYYFDFIVDGKRTNLELDSAIPKWLYRFVQKPKLNFFLYAPVETILSRKKELSPEAITSLTTNYKNLFDDFSKTYPQAYHSIKNIHLEETLDHISQQIKKNI